MRGFVLQLSDNGHYSTETATVEDAISARNWFRPDEKLEVVEYHYNDVTKENTEGFIPVGSVQFVNKVLSFHDKGPMMPINIPKCLREEKFLSRKIAFAKNREEIDKIKTDWNAKHVFIKSNTGVKLWTPELYTGKDIIPEDTEYFVSEHVDFISEWRCFVYRGELRGIKHYLDDEWVMPSKEFINDCIKTIGNTIPSYTLDVGILPNGKTAVIEVHNFLSCGLYGFEDWILIPMLTNAFKYELNRKPD